MRLLNLDRFAIVPGEHKARPTRNGLVFLAVLMVLLYCGFTKTIPFLPKDGDVIKAHFSSATNVISGNAVRVNGVDVGQVTKVERDPSGRGALISMRVTPEGFTVHQDAQASIYWRTLLGRNVYIDLEPGSTDLPKLGSTTIPMNRTEVQVEFDQLLDSYDKDGRAGVRTFFREGDKVLSGPQVGRAVDAMTPALRPAAPALQAMRGTQPGKDLPQLADNAGQTLGALARDEVALGGFLENGNIVLGVTAARRADLGAMLLRAPASLRETRTTLKRVRTTLDILDPVAAKLRPGLRDTAPALNRTTPTLRALSAVTPTALVALGDLRPALVNLRSASAQGQPLMVGIRPTLARLQDEILPFLGEENATTTLKNFQAIGPFFSTLASSSSEFDGSGHVQRFMPGQGLDSLGPLPCSVTAFDPASAGQLAKCTEALKIIPQIVAGAPRKGGGRKAFTGQKGSR